MGARGKKGGGETWNNTDCDHSMGTERSSKDGGGSGGAKLGLSPKGRLARLWTSFLS